MKQYIDKDAIMAKIKKKLQDLIVCKRDTSFIEHKVVLSAKIDMCKEILSILDNLEVKEVDLDKELFNWYNKEKHTDYNASILYEKYNKTLKKLIKHFFLNNRYL